MGILSDLLVVLSSLTLVVLENWKNIRKQSFTELLTLI